MSNFDYPFFSVLLNELTELKTYYEIYNTKSNIEDKTNDKLINDIIKATYDLKKYILNIFWINTNYSYSELKFIVLLEKTIILLHLNLKNLPFFYLPPKMNVIAKSISFYEESILVKTKKINNMLNAKYVKNINIPNNKNSIEDSIVMTYNLLKKLKSEKNSINHFLKASKNKVETNATSKFYSSEIKKLF